MAAATFYSEKSANQRNSLVLMLIIVLILGALGGAIGYALTGTEAGAIGAILIAFAIGAITSIGSYFYGDKLVLAASSAKAVERGAGAPAVRRHP